MVGSSTWQADFRIGTRRRPCSLPRVSPAHRLTDITRWVETSAADWPEAGRQGTLANFEVRDDGTIAPWLSFDRHLTVLRGLWEHQPSTRYPEVHVPALLIGADTGDVAWSHSKHEAVDHALRSASAGSCRVVQPRPSRRARPASRRGRRSALPGHPRSDLLPRHDGAHRMTSPRILAIMGSGETAPTMKGPHRSIFDRLGTDVDAVLLDTPFGFQENAPILASKAIEYFQDAIGRPVHAAGLTRLDTGDTVGVERGVAAVRSADWVFAGPGSPTYSLAQWSGTPVPDAIREKLRSGGAVVFSSAAALTIGRATVPVYEIYKVGVDPFWLDGLDVLAEVGLNVAVIPHYDNAEGGNHDTRFCYLGERRLAMLEPELPEGCFVLGIDEHTGIIMDLDADTAEIVGKGAVTLRRNGTSVRVESGQTVPIDMLRAGPEGTTTTSAAARGSDLGLTPDPSVSAESAGAAGNEHAEPDSLVGAAKAPRSCVRCGTRRPRCRRRGGRDPRPGVGDRRMVPRHAAVRRHRPGSRRIEVDDRATRRCGHRRGARHQGRLGSRGRSSARSAGRGQIREGLRRVRCDP